MNSTLPADIIDQPWGDLTQKSQMLSIKNPVKEERAIKVVVSLSGLFLFLFFFRGDDTTGA